MIYVTTTLKGNVKFDVYRKLIQENEQDALFAFPCPSVLKKIQYIIIGNGEDSTECVMFKVKNVSKKKYKSYESSGFFLDYAEEAEEKAYFLCELSQFKLNMSTNYLNEDIKNSLNKLCSGENKEGFVLIEKAQGEILKEKNKKYKTKLQRLIEEDIFKEALKAFDLYYVGYDEKTEKAIFINKVAKEEHAMIISCKDNTVIFYEKWVGTWKEMIEENFMLFTKYMRWIRSGFYQDFVKPFNMSFKLF